MSREMMIWTGSDEVRGMALTGAQRCIDHWTAEGDDEMVAEAIARFRRVARGTAPVFEVEGALDWLDD